MKGDVAQVITYKKDYIQENDKTQPAPLFGFDEQINCGLHVYLLNNKKRNYNHSCREKIGCYVICVYSETPHTRLVLVFYLNHPKQFTPSI
jgi:hypothetical protein